MHSLNKLWLLVLVFTCGCCTSKIVGYLDNRSDKIQSEKPVIAVPADHFTILRNEFTNSYDIRINEKQYFYARNSVDNEAYEILLIATTGTLPWNAPVRLVCPALY
jgi:hypothetical protein